MSTFDAGPSVPPVPSEPPGAGGHGHVATTRLEVVKSFRFEAAHLLPNVAESHKCRRLHGHSFAVDVHVRGPLGPVTGWVLDFADVAGAWEPVHELVDHRYLNEVPGLDNPTSEVLAVWIWDHLSPSLPGLAKVVVHETCTSAVVYERGSP